jgi:lipid-binding SYLF domain-containing protein
LILKGITSLVKACFLGRDLTSYSCLFAFIRGGLKQKKTKQVKKMSMMKRSGFFILLITVMVALGVSNPAQADKFLDTIDTFKKSEAVRPFLKSAYGYAVFPTVGKGGIGIGGAYGKGQVYRGGRVTGETKLFKATIGFQLGGQAFSEIIFFQDKRAYDEFTAGSFEFDAAASAVAITAGAQAKGGTEGATAGASAGPATGKQAKTSYHKGMAVFVHTKGGLMYEAAIGGQKFTFKAK